MKNRSTLIVLLAVIVSMAVVTIGELRADESWPWGCCTATSDCKNFGGVTFVCCDPPTGWGPCGQDDDSYCYSVCPLPDCGIPGKPPCEGK